MKNVFTRASARSTATLLLGALVLGGAVLTMGVTTAPSVASASTVPPWEPDANSVGGLTFYNAAGDVITGGNTTDSPLAAYVEGTGTIRAGDTKASLYGYLPVHGATPPEWSGEVLSGSTAYPNASAPSPINAATLPVVTGAAGDETVAQLEGDFPNNDTSNDGYAHMYVLRLKTSAVAKPGNTTYDSADIEVTGSTWSVVYPIPPASTTTTASVLPTKTTFGTSVAYSTTVTSGSGTPTGSVAFTVGSTTLCSTPLTSGSGSCNASSAPVGADVVTATYSGAGSFASSVGSTSLVVTSGPYSPLTPVRICDTRNGNPSGLSGAAAQCNSSTLAAGSTKTINVANSADGGSGSFGVPADATAVVLNVTAAGPAGSGYVTVFPAGASQPTASNLNYVAGAAVPNLVEVGVGTSGDVSFYSSGQTDLVVDVQGYTAPTASGGVGAGLYNALSSPVRICDTRASSSNSPLNQCSGRTLGTAGSINVAVTRSNDIPAGAAAAVLNVTAVNPASQGYITVYPQGGAKPTASNVNYTVGKVSSNRVIVPLSASGQITVFSSQSADVLVDVSGYYSKSGGTGTQFSAEAAPVRICDTRAVSSSAPSNQCSGRTIGPASTLSVQVTGNAGVPTNATAVVVNLTGIHPSAQTFLSVFPALPRPNVSDMNPGPGTVKANMVVATLSPTGTISIYNNAGSIDVAVDVLGWYS